MRDIIIDGSEGEGGGQVLRSSLSLSAITGKPVRIHDVRGKRKKPGLMRQHLTALRAAAEICRGKVEGDAPRSSEIALHPGEIKAGEYRFDIGSAGGTSLVVQTVLPILSMADGPSRVTVTGGTHNDWAPSTSYLQKVFLPLFRTLGGRAELELIRHGFYPAGGGEVCLTVEPMDRIEHPKPLNLKAPGKRTDASAEILLSSLKRDIGEREAKTLCRLLALPDDAAQIHHVQSPGPGNVVSLFLTHAHVTEGFMALGEHGKTAEAVAKDVARQAKDYMTSGAACGPHLTDQLLLPLALTGGGSFTSSEITQHSQTNRDIIGHFLDVDITFTELGRKLWQVEVARV